MEGLHKLINMTAPVCVSVCVAAASSVPGTNPLKLETEEQRGCEEQPGNTGGGVFLPMMLSVWQSALLALGTMWEVRLLSETTDPVVLSNRSKVIWALQGPRVVRGLPSVVICA